MSSLWSKTLPVDISASRPVNADKMCAGLSGSTGQEVLAINALPDVFGSATFGLSYTLPSASITDMSWNNAWVRG